MKNNQSFVFQILVMGMIFVSSFNVGAKSLDDSKPNIILILLDDMGYSDLGCFGSEIQTPNIDKLAFNGIRYTHFTNNAKCETTRASLMSGRTHTEITKNRSKNVVTIPENLALGGYQNFMVGKWHIFDKPWQRGFERYFGFTEGATNFFTGESGGGNGKFTYFLDDEPYQIPDNFYSTDAFTDYAIQFIDERKKDRPFFMYVAHNAPHYPLQAPKKDVMKYRGKYMEGWGKLRETRFKRMKELRVIPAGMPLSKPEEDVRSWNSLDEKTKDRMDLIMATYAAMIDRVDQQLGRLIQKLENEKILDDTLILFLSDNGACPFDRTKKETLENNYMPWDERSFWCYTKEWANACNTPFRMYKQNQHEGGIATSMVAHWPNGITVPGAFNRQRGHLIDFHATFRELAGVDYPADQAKLLLPMRGISLVPSFKGEKRNEHKFYYQNFSNQKTALIIGKWKLVNNKHLYDMKADRIESKDLSALNPEKFQFMLREFVKYDQIYNEGRVKVRAEKSKNKK